MLCTIASLIKRNTTRTSSQGRISRFVGLDAKNAFLQITIPVICESHDTRRLLPPPADPSAFPFTPVPRRGKRHDGWTAERQRAFIAALADTGCVTSAAQSVDMSVRNAYALRRASGAEEFAAAWEAALDAGIDNLESIAIRRAIDGVPVPIMHGGEQVGERRWYNDRLLMFVLRGRRSQRYGAARDVRREAERQVEEQQAHVDRQRTREQSLASIQRKVHAIRSSFKRDIAADPAKRAAWELLAGPTDWADFDAYPSYGSPGGSPTNQNRPDIILSFAGSDQPMARQFDGRDYDEDDADGGEDHDPLLNRQAGCS